MREMGSVELLTREGEIEIAKRIEDGLKQMIMGSRRCRPTIVEILDLSTRSSATRCASTSGGRPHRSQREGPAAQELAVEPDVEEEERRGRGRGSPERRDHSRACCSSRRTRSTASPRSTGFNEKLKVALVKFGHRSKEYLKVREQISTS